MACNHNGSWSSVTECMHTNENKGWCEAAIVKLSSEFQSVKDGAKKVVLAWDDASTWETQSIPPKEAVFMEKRSSTHIGENNDPVKTFVQISDTQAISRVSLSTLTLEVLDSGTLEIDYFEGACDHDAFCDSIGYNFTEIKNATYVRINGDQYEDFKESPKTAERRCGEENQGLQKVRTAS